MDDYDKYNIVISHCKVNDNIIQKSKELLNNKFKNISFDYEIYNPRFLPKTTYEEKKNYPWAIDYTKNILEDKIKEDNSIIIVSRTVLDWLLEFPIYSDYNFKIFSIRDKVSYLDIVSQVYAYLSINNKSSSFFNRMYKK
jgi:hypothetical protein